MAVTRVIDGERDALWASKDDSDADRACNLWKDELGSYMADAPPRRGDDKHRGAARRAA